MSEQQRIMQDGVYPDLPPRGFEDYRDPNMHPSTHSTSNERKSSFDLESLGAKVLGSLADQVFHSNDKSQSHYAKPQEEKDSFDFSRVGTALFGSITDQFSHSSHDNVNQIQQPSNKGPFDLGQIGQNIVSSLADQVLHPKHDSEKVTENQQPSSKENKEHFDWGEIGQNLVSSVTDQILHPKHDKHDVSQNQGSQHKSDSDIGSFLGSLAENVLNSNNKENQASTVRDVFADQMGKQAAAMFENFADSILGTKKENQHPPQGNYGPQGHYPPPQYGAPEYYESNPKPSYPQHDDKYINQTDDKSLDSDVLRNIADSVIPSSSESKKNDPEAGA